MWETVLVLSEDWRSRAGEAGMNASLSLKPMRASSKLKSPFRGIVHKEQRTKESPHSFRGIASNKIENVYVNKAHCCNHSARFNRSTDA